MSWQDSDAVRKLFVGNSAAKSVLRCLADFRNEKTGQCNPSTDAIAKETELNRKTVYKAITYLEEKGFIRRERVVLNSSNNYVLNLTTNADSTKNGSTKNGSTKYGTSPKNGLSVVPNMGRVVGPNLGHEPLNESVNEPVNNSIESAPDFSLTAPEKTTISKTETVEKKAKRKSKAKQPCPFNDGDPIPEDFVKVAEQYHIANPQLLFQKMISYCKSNGKEYVDYKAAFRTFCIQDQERNRVKQSSGTNSNNSAPMPYEPPGGFTEDYYRKGCKFDDKGNILL